MVSPYFASLNDQEGRNLNLFLGSSFSRFYFGRFISNMSCVWQYQLGLCMRPMGL